MRLPSLLPILLAACALTEDRFDDRLAEKWCARQKACDEDAFFAAWELGTPDCRQEVASAVNSKRYGNGSAACTYSEEQASSCVDEVAAASCDDILDEGFVDACAEPVWDCISIVNPGNP